MPVLGNCLVGLCTIRNRQLVVAKDMFTELFSGAFFCIEHAQQRQTFCSFQCGEEGQGSVWDAVVSERALGKYLLFSSHFGWVLSYTVRLGGETVGVSSC